MRHNLSEQQYNRMFQNIMFNQRLLVWNEKFGHLPVTYDEVDPNADLWLESANEPPGFWGFLEGDEKHINWILMQL